VPQNEEWGGMVEWGFKLREKVVAGMAGISNY